MKKTDERCSHQYFRDHGFTLSQCRRKGTIEEEGKFWCWQHAPSAAKQRYEDTITRYNEKLEEKRRRDMRRSWDLVIGKLRRMNPKLAQEVERMATKDEQT